MYTIYKCTGTNLCNLPIEMYWYMCYNINKIREAENPKPQKGKKKMTKEKFIEFINSRNYFNAERGYNDTFEFISYHSILHFGLLKETVILRDGRVLVNYRIYVFNEFYNDFIPVRSFRDFNSAESALSVLIK